jgi:hypothetical protein
LIEFKNDVQKQVYERIKPWVKEVFGEFAQTREDAPAFGVFVGSALAQVWVQPWRQDDAVVTVRSYVVTGAEMRPDLAEYLVRENDKLLFGSFSVDGENDIAYTHSILGSSCDRAQLKASVMAVVTTADKYDDEIVRRWGGRRALDS